MTYVFDTNVFSQLFGCYYRSRFPSLWARFEDMMLAGQITSTREVMLELAEGRSYGASDWATTHLELFPNLTADEGQFITQIFLVPHFQQIIDKKLKNGGRNADTFIIARAEILGGIVVTQESEPPHGARIPNICRHFGIDCYKLEDFMERENWSF